MNLYKNPFRIQETMGFWNFIWEIHIRNWLYKFPCRKPTQETVGTWIFIQELECMDFLWGIYVGIQVSILIISIESEVSGFLCLLIRVYQSMLDSYRKPYENPPKNAMWESRLNPIWIFLRVSNSISENPPPGFLRLSSIDTSI